MRRLARAGLIAACCAASSCTPAGRDRIVFKASSSSAPSEPTVRGLEVFGEELARATDGRIVVEVYPNNALGNEREVIELTILGAVEIACPANAPLATFSPELLVFVAHDRDVGVVVAVETRGRTRGVRGAAAGPHPGRGQCRVAPQPDDRLVGSRPFGDFTSRTSTTFMAIIVIPSWRSQGLF